jgi:site-specific recombinase XerD
MEPALGEIVPLRRATGNSPDIRDLVPSWELALDQEGKSPGTIRSYTDTVRKLGKWLHAAALPTGVEDIETEDIRAWLAARMEATSSGNAAKEYRNLAVFWNWCVKEDERTGPNPMLRIGKPKVAAKAHKIFTTEELTDLVVACSGPDWESKRDLAIIRILMDNGVRVSGLAGLRYTPNDPETNDVYLARHRLRVTLKGGREFWAPIGKKAAAAVDAYIRKRARRPHADSPWLWLPARGGTTATGDVRLTASGIGQMLERRGEQAGVQGVHPHRFRRTMASTWEGDSMQLMDIGGWESLEMVRLYSRAGREERARQAHERLSPGDRI